MPWQWVNDGTDTGFLPWGTNWGSAPWAGVPGNEEQRQQAMAWMNVMLPWLQASQQGQQWGSEFDWRKAMDEWSQQFQGEQFDWQKAIDEWSQQFQEKQLAWQQEFEPERLAMETFGRRWMPNTRWM